MKTEIKLQSTCKKTIQEIPIKKSTGKLHEISKIAKIDEQMWCRNEVEKIWLKQKLCGEKTVYYSSWISLSRYRTSDLHVHIACTPHSPEKEKQGWNSNRIHEMLNGNRREKKQYSKCWTKFSKVPTIRCLKMFTVSNHNKLPDWQ